MDDQDFVEEVAQDAELPNFAYRDQDFDDGLEAPEGEVFTLEGSIKSFLVRFYNGVVEQNISEIYSSYDSAWNKLSARYFSDKPWPSAELVAPLVDNDSTFLILYKELSFRHLYAKNNLSPYLTLDQRFASFENYCDLFNYILNADEPVQLELPNQWLWDIIDEFIYQFQSFCQYRAKLKNRSPHEIQLLKENPQIWNVHSVLNVLHSLIDKSKIQEQLSAIKKGEDVSAVAGEFGSRTLYKMLGYFSIIGLLRLHCLLGDYYLALDVMSNIDLKQKSLFNRITPCYITTYYYVGFCYLMMRRYQDATRTFSQILCFISRTMQYHTRSFQFDMIKKQNDQMYSLLAIAISLSPQRIDETVANTLRETHGEKIDQIQQGEKTETFEEWFRYSCPKFISPFAPNYDAPELQNLHQEPLLHQLKLFLMEARQQLRTPIIRSYLKLYTSMDTSKLAGFLEVDEEAVKTSLLCYKHKTRQKRWESGSAFDGEYSSLTDINFYLKDNMIHITETKSARRFGDYFVRHINKFEDLMDNWSRQPRT